ncbi:hypothetical protein [Fuerstiella marisgermanici]|uniref:Cohesin domain-containing protein n=1 Tax=Fuerstiella marisgermanici TaxID=1891926 RepID=A0A1P8WL64_9PLAN|nr:hypothetical protein [Fuerstiella marisgermanici]APZ94787.1 hypothetical protein Fuma_04426 [Fuerstiella marisgermanici]
MNVAINNSEYCGRRWQLPLAWLVLIVFDLCLVALVCAQDGKRSAEPNETSVPVEIVQIEGVNEAKPDGVRFEAIDVFVDSGEERLAAYQFELASKTDGVQIVGIEGGEHAAFKEPPYYDPKAMNNNRVIIAAFNAGENLPAGRSRVARIHVQLRGPGVKEYETKLSVSATSDGEQIPAKVAIAKAKA